MDPVTTISAAVAALEAVASLGQTVATVYGNGHLTSDQLATLWAANASATAKATADLKAAIAAQPAPPAVA